MSISFGVSPIAWINDDMPELGGDTPVETVLADARDIGFAGIELGGKFPRDHRALKRLVGDYDLKLVAGWYSASLLTRTAKQEIDALREHLEMLQSVGSDVFIMAETSNAVHGVREVPLNRSPQLTKNDWQRFGERLTEVGDFLKGEGSRLAYHHHLGTVVETQEELDLFLESTDDVVGLTLDTGHAALGGIRAAKVIRRAPKRIVHVHCKDVRQSVFRAVSDSESSFLEGVLKGMFTVPGDGDLDFVEIFQALFDVKYSGWIIVEAEQDPAMANPRVYARLGLNILRAKAALVGLKEAA